MKRYLFARILRASGRLMLFAGTMLGLGLAAIHVYLFVYRLLNHEPTIQPIGLIPNKTTGAIYDSPNTATTIVTATISIIVAIGLIALIAKIYNNHMRQIIARIARLFKAQIFTIEVVGTLIAWTITVLSMAPILPAASIVATFAFIINELLFVFAWGAYGQPNYKI